MKITVISWRDNMKRILGFVLGAALAWALYTLYQRLSPSRKRFLAYLARQVPYLPLRYTV